MLDRVALVLAVLALLVHLTPANGGADAAAPLPRFEMQEIDTTLGVGYGVLLVDVDGDGKRDIVVVDTNRILWYQNPTWKRRVILQGMTLADNVAIAAHDIDGDGKLDFAIAAAWKGLNPNTEGTLQWLQQGKTPDDPWTLHRLGAEPTAHRIRFIDLEGTGRPRLVVGPLLGRKSTQKNNWRDDPVRLRAYRIPGDPVHEPWPVETLDASMHVLHNFWPQSAEGRKGMDILTASYEGLTLVSRDPGGPWKRTSLGAGNQDNPLGSRGSSEVKPGQRGGRRFIATIEPFHGHQVVIYLQPRAPGAPWLRQVIDDHLKWGHAVWTADLDGDGADELIVGVRDDKSLTPGERRGVRIYRPTDAGMAKWTRTILDEGGIACEDLAAADLNGDGRIDIVAVGRQTHNVRIYWNKGGP